MLNFNVWDFIVKGGIIIPIFTNIYLYYIFDLWFEKVVKPKAKGFANYCGKSKWKYFMMYHKATKKIQRR